jgi:hypothetical protein
MNEQENEIYNLEKQKLDLKHYEDLLYKGEFVKPVRVERVYDED